LATPIGALSGKSVQVILPAAVSMMAVGLAPVAPVVAGLAAVLGLAGAAGLLAAAWPNDMDADINSIPRIAGALCMGAPWKRSGDC
jgi:hypothetical protein